MTKRPERAGASFPIRVRWEIWESLLSMLRVYAYAASVNHGEVAVTALSDAAWVRHKGNVLGLCFRPSDGLAGWRLLGTDSTEARGAFQIMESGALHFPGREKQLDQAAIDWVEALIEAGKRMEEKEKAIRKAVESLAEELAGVEEACVPKA